MDVLKTTTAVQDTNDSAETRQRLLQAGAEIFGEKGFRRTTVREICERAGANVAAVNYHFGDKEKLYEAVFRAAHKQVAADPLDIDPQELAKLSKEEKLKTFISRFLVQISGPDACCGGRLMVFEMIEPTHVLDAVVKEQIGPKARMLGAILREFLGDDAEETLVRQCGHSVIGQILHYQQARAVIERLHPQQKYNAKDIEQLAQHITDFSVAALKSIVKVRGNRR